jgi:flagellar biosynthesis/type III secretory pathway chaperone
MRDSVTELLKILTSENEMYQSFERLAHKKTEILIQSEADELMKIVGEEELLLKELKIMEHQRQEVMKRICEECQLDNIEANLQEVLGHFEDEEAKKVQEIQLELKENVKKLKMMNEKNEALIKSSLEYIDFSLNVLSNAKGSSGDNNYGNKGEVNQKSKKAMFDVKL